MPVTADYQIELNGVLLGPGTDYEIRNIDGLDSPPVRARSTDRLGHGAIALGADWYSQRIIAVDLEVYAATAALLTPKLQALSAAFAAAAADVTVKYQLPGTSVLRVYGRPRECKYRIDIGTDAGVAVCRARIDCNDPRQYADTASTDNSVIAGSGTTDTDSLTNSGTTDTFQTVTVNGNVPTGWLRITHVGQSRSVKINTTGLTHATDVVVINFATRSVTVNGVAFDQLVDSTTRWFALAPGANSVTFDRANADAYSSTAAHEWRSAWL